MTWSNRASRLFFIADRSGLSGQSATARVHESSPIADEALRPGPLVAAWGITLAVSPLQLSSATGGPSFKSYQSIAPPAVKPYQKTTL